MTTKYQATFTLLNIIMGSGPLIIPQPFYQAGFILSTIWLVTIGFTSFICAEYIIETLARTNSIKSRQKMLSDKMKQSIITEESMIENSQLLETETRTINTSVEYGEMSMILSGKRASIFTITIVTIYLMGVTISKCILAGKVLSKVFDHVNFLNKIYPWLALFFICGGVFSFKDVASTKILQFFIIGIRCLALGAMLIGAIYVAAAYGGHSLTENGVANFEYFPELFSNTLFSMVCHHSISSIVSPIKPQAGIRFAIRFGFFVSILLSLIIPLTGVIAFGSNLVSSQKGNLKYYNYAFEEHLPLVYYFISFYVFLNIAAIPVLIIVVRNNILKMAVPTINPNQFSKTTLVTTVILLSIVLIVSLAAQNYIQYVLDFTGGICGILILIILPAFMVARARVKTPQLNEVQSFQAMISNKYVPYGLIIIALVFLIYNLTQVITKLIS